MRSFAPSELRTLISQRVKVLRFKKRKERIVEENRKTDIPLNCNVVCFGDLISMAREGKIKKTVKTK